MAAMTPNPEIPTARLALDSVPLRTVEANGELVEVRDDDALRELIEAYARQLAQESGTSAVSFEVAFPGDVEADTFDAYAAIVTPTAVTLETLPPYAELGVRS